VVIHEKRPITREFAVRYRVAKTKAKKSRILTDFIIATAFNRKYAIGILGSEGRTRFLLLEGNRSKPTSPTRPGKTGPSKNAMARM
jgi:hypothetical protein